MEWREMAKKSNYDRRGAYAVVVRYVALEAGKYSLHSKISVVLLYSRDRSFYLRNFYD